MELLVENRVSSRQRRPPARERAHAVACDQRSPKFPLLLAALGVGATKPMSGINFNSWTENATRLGMRIQETLAERTKDLSSLTSSGAGYYDTGEEKAKNIKAQLDSGSEREKLEAMKRLIAVSVSHTYSLRVTQSEVLDDFKRP